MRLPASANSSTPTKEIDPLTHTLMIATLAFSIIAAVLVFVAGRRDSARDPRLTVSLLLLCAVFPAMAAVMPKFAVASSTANERGVSWATLLAGVWAVGFLVALSRLVFAFALLHGWRKRSSLVSFVDDVEIRTLDELSGPVAAGVCRRVIFVPAAWHEWCEDYQRVVLEHELAHHRRRDPLWRLLAQLTCAVHWWNPFVHWMTRRLVMQCEFACDAIVLQRGVAARTYAEVLCDFASRKIPSRLVLGMAEVCPLEYRVLRMLKPPCEHGKLPLLLAAFGFLTACSLSMIGLKQQAPAIIPATETELRWTADPFPAEP
jgi:beta-lactamase regulating signal transducer with metallopeptidase domain